MSAPPPGPVGANARRRAALGVELALWSCSVTLVLSFGRLFDSWEFAPRLLGVVTAAHLVPALLRRRGLRPAVAVPVGLASGTVVIAAFYLPGTTAFGLPTPASAQAASAAMRRAFGPFEDLVAPVPATLGFQLTLAIGLWIIVMFGDAATTWARATVQGVVPHVAAFVFSSVLARSAGFVPATAAFGASLALLALAANLRRTDHQRWAPGDEANGRASQLRWGLAMIAGVVVTLAAAAPALPGLTSPGWVDLRRLGQGNGPRVVDSPLVGISSLLDERSDEVMFAVEGSTLPHYWRLTALETFDGSTWSSNATYRDVDDGERLPGDVPGGRPPTEERHRFEIDGLVSAWLPAAPVPRVVEADFDVRFHAPSASLFLADEDTPMAQRRYEVASALTRLGIADLSGTADDVAEPAASMTSLPADRRDALASRATLITADADDDYAEALALERFFRDDDSGFVYDREADYRGEADPIAAFLDRRQGFCQQYAGTYAALARAVGLPARVAVGFTFGDPGPDADTWIVRGRHAHAWPEVHISGVGWVAFEPTPGRGNPDAESYTGRPPSQQLPGGLVGGLATTTTTTTTVAASPSSAPASSLPEPDRATRAGGSEVPERDAGPGLLVIGTVAALVLAAAVVAARWRWARRRRSIERAAPAGDRVASAWRRAWSDAARLGVAADPAETPIEAGERLRTRLGVDAARTLARLESDRRYASVDVDPEGAATAEAAADEIRELVSTGLDRAGRFRMELDL